MTDKKIRRVSKDEWLSEAMDTLAREGIGGVNIEKLARKLGIAKSGFYWHFRDRQDLLTQMLEYWIHEYTEVITQNKSITEGPATKRLESMVRTIYDYDLNRFEAAIFIWSQSDLVAKEAFDRAFEIRLGFIRKVFSDLGFKDDELEMRTQLLAGYTAWEYTVFRQQSKAKQERLLKLRLRLLTKK